MGGTEKEGETSATGGEDLHAPFAAAHNRYFQEFHDAYVAGTAKAHEAHRKLMEGEAEAHRAFWERCEEARQALLRTMAEITGEDDAAVQARFDAHRAYNDALGAAEQERVHREEGLREDYVRVAREIETVGYEGLRSLLGEYLTRFQKALADLPVREIDARDVMIISHSMATIASHAAALPPR